MTAPLTAHDRALIEATARRVVELLNEEQAPPVSRLVDAAELARHLGVSRATVYDRADELGAVPIGDGRRPRLRFDLARALAAWTARQPEPDAAEPVVPRRRKPSPSPSLLPVRGREAA